MQEGAVHLLRCQLRRGSLRCGRTCRLDELVRVESPVVRLNELVIVITIIADPVVFAGIIIKCVGLRNGATLQPLRGETARRGVGCFGS